MDIISRKDAKALGLKWYFTGKPCKHGHVCERLVKSRSCYECCREYKSSPAGRQAALKYYYRHVDARRLYSAEFYRKNKERISVSKQAWRKNNKVRIAARTKRWQTTHPELYRRASALRRALKIQACPKWVNREELRLIYEACPAGHHVDHVIPLNHPLVCGLHVPANLKPIPAKENLTKSNSFDPNTHVHIFPEQEPNERTQSVDSETDFRLAA